VDYRGDQGGLKMAEKVRVERRTAIADRRLQKMDRRQFIDIGWELEKERRALPTDRRLGPRDRRGL